MQASLSTSGNGILASNTINHAKPDTMETYG
ncbi:hypothetical protein XELAEV_180357382mg, partial [Xenopus laevis]